MVGGVLVFRDVTERRSQEQQLHVAQRLASVGVLAMGVAHQVNNPLAYLLSNCDDASQALAALHAHHPTAHTELQQVASIVRTYAGGHLPLCGDGR